MKYILSLVIVCALMAYDVPKGWLKAGSSAGDYEMRTDVKAGRNQQNAATIKSVTDKISGFGTLMQNCSPEKYKGKRLKLTAYMKSVNVKEFAGMWLRVDGDKLLEPLGFDNMYERPVTGTTDWTKCEIVLDVPMEATNLAYGALLSGTGQIWFSDLEFDVVSDDVPTTGRSKGKINAPAKPRNLKFTE